MVWDGALFCPLSMHKYINFPQYLKILHISTARLSIDTAKSCFTDVGGGPMTAPATCKFPFSYQGKLYHQCTKQDHDKPWCALEKKKSHYGHECKKCWKNEIYTWANCAFGGTCGLGKHKIIS